jgi:hypothetical protein
VMQHVIWRDRFCMMTLVVIFWHDVFCTRWKWKCMLQAKESDSDIAYRS